MGCGGQMAGVWPGEDRFRLAGCTYTTIRSVYVHHKEVVRTPLGERIEACTYTRHTWAGAEQAEDPASIRAGQRPRVGRPGDRRCGLRSRPCESHQPTHRPLAASPRREVPGEAQCRARSRGRRTAVGEIVTRQTAVYRLYDAGGQLLYVGIAYDPDARWLQHASTSPWWPLVTQTKVEWKGSREDAEDAECRAIQAEAPRYNSAGSSTPMNVSVDFPVPDEVSAARARSRLADVLHGVSTSGKVTYITHQGRRRAAFVPLHVAEQYERDRLSRS
jgi:hypothetical protein